MGAFHRLAAASAAAADPSADMPAFLWPSNVRIWALWREIGTQWRYSPMGGATGLDYAAVLAVIDRRFSHRRQRREAWYLVQGMEDATLDTWRRMADAAKE